MLGTSEQEPGQIDRRLRCCEFGTRRSGCSDRRNGTVQPATSLPAGERDGLRSDMIDVAPVLNGLPLMRELLIAVLLWFYGGPHSC